ncbi:MAG: HRDC domain-containing protein [Myxococcales bacterium]
MLSTAPEILQLVEALRRSPFLCLDTEADSLHCYPEKLCLVQLSHAGGDELVDPLGPAEPLAPLFEHLASRELTLHGASFDLRLLRRARGMVAREVFDTELAARLVGRPKVGLRDLVQELLGVTLDKGAQKANWSQRPLTPKMEEYARGDTHHLKALREALEAELSRLGRTEWHRETCARLIVDSVPAAPDPEAAWRVKGSSLLRPRALAIVRELYLWREEQAVALNRPPYFVLSHELLVAAAEKSAKSGAPELSAQLRPHQHKAVEDAIRRALALPDSALPRQELHSRPARPSDEVQRRFEAIRRRRDERALALNLDPTLIANKADLLALAEDFDKAAASLMKWQVQLLSA